MLTVTANASTQCAAHYTVKIYGCEKMQEAKFRQNFTVVFCKFLNASNDSKIFRNNDTLIKYQKKCHTKLGRQNHSGETTAENFAKYIFISTHLN